MAPHGLVIVSWLPNLASFMNSYAIQPHTYVAWNPPLMRRQPLACRRAVQSLQATTSPHVWISDELLSTALRRLFPSSCPHQKRHGSHVPGPLEARRRAAKRRMTVSAGFHPSDPWPVHFSLSDIFGFRSDWKPSWRYEPPTLQPKTQALQSPDTCIPPSDIETFSQTIPHPTFARTVSQGVAYSFAPNLAPGRFDDRNGAESVSSEHISTQPAPAATGHNAAQNQISIMDPASCFQTFKQQLAKTPVDAEGEYGHNLAEAYGAHCPNQSNAWIFNTLVLEYLAETGRDPWPVLKAISAPTFVIPPIHSTWTQNFLDALRRLQSQHSECEPYVHQLYLRLAESAMSAANSTTKTHDTNLLAIAHYMLSSSYAQLASGNETVDRVASNIVQKLRVCHETRPLKRHYLMASLVSEAEQDFQLAPVVQAVLQCIPNTVLSDLISDTTCRFAGQASYGSYANDNLVNLFDAWIRLLCQPGFSGSRTPWLEQAITSLSKSTFAHHRAAGRLLPPLLHAILVQTQSPSSDQSLSITQILELLSPDDYPTTKSNERFPVNTTFDMLMSRMCVAGLSTRRLVQHVVDTFATHANLHQLLRILNVLQKRNILLHHSASLLTKVEEQVSKVKLYSKASVSTKQQEAVILGVGQKVSAVVARISAAPSVEPTISLNELQAQEHFQRIFESAQANHALPLIASNLAADMPSEERVGFIHQLAHHYSLDITRSQREVSRSIYALYKYLRRHSLPIGPLFSKALVRASLARPLSENRFVSASRLKWVLKLVEEVEGKNVASKIESIFWRWRGDLIMHAKQAHIAAGGDRREKTSIAMMKKLNIT